MTNSPAGGAELRTFLTVHRSGSFTAAAALPGPAQPTVTPQVRALERRLGRRLLERPPRGVAPTPVAVEPAAQVTAPLDALAAVAGDPAGRRRGGRCTWRVPAGRRPCGCRRHRRRCG
ncbi:helix-turn-helix domain-containing protein [Actinomadura keratinilytica]|uniref:helix-turn-helix domain-containing protein n=1 Tax=Actinomadura keratinilytica TaxID=547461 RepID=UPI003618DABB